MFKTKHEAIKAVEKHQRQGAKSIDIGVMQINLRHHPFAFRNLEEAFDPQLNIAYGAKFLKQLFAQHKSWNAAIGHYHSASPKFHNIYKNKVLNNWFGLGKNKNVDAHHLSKALMNADEIPANDTKPLKRHGVKINHAEPYARLKRVYYPLDNSSSAPLPVNERRKSYTIKNISARHYYALD